MEERYMMLYYFKAMVVRRKEGLLLASDTSSGSAPTLYHFKDTSKGREYKSYIQFHKGTTFAPDLSDARRFSIEGATGGLPLQLCEPRQ